MYFKYLILNEWYNLTRSTNKTGFFLHINTIDGPLNNLILTRPRKIMYMVLLEVKSHLKLYA